MNQKLSSVTLLQRLREGDSQAEEQLFCSYAPRLLDVARQNMGKVVKRRLDPEDVVQSVFRTFIRRSGEGEYRFDTTEKLWRLLVKVTVLKTRESARRHTAKKRNVRAETGQSSDELPLEPSFPDPGPDEAAALVDLMESLFQGLHSAYAKVVELRLGGYSANEIAEELGISRPTVYRALERAQERLQSMLTEES